MSLSDDATREYWREMREWLLAASGRAADAEAAAELALAVAACDRALARLAGGGPRRASSPA